MFSSTEQGSGGKFQPHSLLPSRLQKTVAPTWREIWRKHYFPSLVATHSFFFPNKEASKISQNLTEPIIKHSGRKLLDKKTTT